MIGWYKDAALTLRVSPETPKRFLLPLKGGKKTASLYLGDPYNATITALVSSGASTIPVDQTFEFPASGSAVVSIPASGGVPASLLVINYSGITANSLTGVTGVTQDIPSAAKVRPNITWRSRTNIMFLSSGTDSPGNVTVAFGLPVSSVGSNRLTAYSVAGGVYISPVSSISGGVSNAIRVDAQIIVPPGSQREFTAWQMMTSTFYAYQAGDLSTIPATAMGTIPTAAGYVLRRDQMLPMAARLLPSNRQVNQTVPGFVIGQYRWRDEATVNAAALVETRWDADVHAIGIEKFASGIGVNDDLKPLGLVEDGNSVYLNIQDGSYFDGPARYFLPGTNQLEIHNGASLTHLLNRKPASLKPVFVGTWHQDSAGFYSVATAYRKVSTFVNDGSYQYQLNRRTLTVTTNLALAQQTLFIGLLSGSGSDTFSLPVYPLLSIKEMYIPLAGNIGQAQLNSYKFDPDEGTVTVNYTPGGLYAADQPVYVIANPAVAVQYEPEPADQDEITNVRQVPVDLNPAFAGLSKGVVYLQHRQLAPSSVTLSCDKPLIPIPATYSSLIDLVAYGPVYFNGDFALLSATAYGPLGKEVVPNAELKVVVDPTTWSGLINYQDPTVEDVRVTTGSDGIANLIFTPQKDWGIYLPNADSSGTFGVSGFLAGLATTTVTHDTVKLPQAVPVSEVIEGSNWLTTFYSVLDNNPVYGKIGADPTLGEVAWKTTGTPGAIGYRTNGQLIAWGGSTPVRPLKALDVNGKNYDEVGFTGNVVALVFSQAVPAASGTGAYFVSFLQRVNLKLQAIGSAVVSNSILLQMADPPLIVDNPWLVLSDIVQGYLNQYRLNRNSLVSPTSRFSSLASLVSAGFGSGPFNTQPFNS